MSESQTDTDTETETEQVVRIGHPDDVETFPVEEMSVEEYLEDPQRLYELDSVVELCQALGVPYAQRGDWIWVDFDRYRDNGGAPSEIPFNTDEVIDILAGDPDAENPSGLVGFRHSQRAGNSGLAYHKCEDGALQRNELEFTDPQEA